MRGSPASLDDPTRIAAIDRSGMLSAVAGLGEQLRRGFEIGKAVSIPVNVESQSAIVVCGMGGSGIAGDVVRAVLAERVRYPVFVSKGYVLPTFCGPETLVFAVSYSGNTEEAVAMYEQAIGRGCKTVSISTGGRLGELSEATERVHLELPGDAPMPRAALGYLAGAILGALADLDLSDFVDEVDAAARLLQKLAAGWKPDVSIDENEAKALAEWLGDRTPLIWGSEGLTEPVALRWKNQMNENAKVPAFWSVLPELDHNEVEGWSPQTAKEFAVIALRHGGEHPRVTERFGLTADLASGAGLEVREVRAQGRGPMEWLFSLVMLGDFVSTYLAIRRGVDPTPVPALTGLKERLRR